MRTLTQKLAFLLVAVLCCAGMQVKADELTVAAGYATNYYLPVYGSYVDTQGARQQCLFPADSIADMAGGSISQMTFYLATPAEAAWDGAVIQVSLGEVSETSLASGFVTNGLTTVYTGALDATQSTMVVVFDDAFDYAGENLVVEFLVLTGGTWKSTYFLGVNNVTALGCYSSSASGSGTVLDFMPQTTFEFVSGSGPVCDKPSSITASDITESGATLAWADGSGIYNVEYKKASDENWTSLLQSTTAHSAPLAGLEVATAYQARVQSVCGEDLSSWRTVSFKTLCGVISSFPYSLDFEAMEAGALPMCWDNSGSTTTTAAGSNSHYVWGVYAYDGNKMIRMYNYYVQSGIALINTPSIILPDAPEYELSFDYSNRADCGELILKVSADGGETWDDLAAYASTGTNDYTDPGDFEEAIVDLGAYAGQSIMLQFYTEANYGHGAIFVDNIDIHRFSTCFVPTGLSAAGVSKTAGQIQWDANASESAWHLQYKKSADSEWISVSVTENPYLLEGLETYTSYDVRVAAVCDDEEESKFTKTVSFKTAAGIPYAETFDDYAVPSDWKRYSVPLADVWNGDTTLVTPVSTGWTVGSGNGVFTASDYHLKLEVYGETRKEWIVTPFIELEENIQLTFDLALTKATGTLAPVEQGQQDDDKFYVLYSINAGESWEELVYWDNASSADPFDAISCTAEGQSVKVDLSEFAGESMAFAFYGESTVAGGDNNLHIDNVRVDYIPACEKPSGLAVSAITEASATFIWDEAEDGPADWQYALIANPAADFVPADADFTGATSELMVTINTLSENTQYAFFLRRDCGDAQSEYLVRNFRTIMTPVDVPYEDDFEAGNNWLLINGDMPNAWAYGEAAANGGTHALYISNDGGASNVYTKNADAVVYAVKSFRFDEDAHYTFNYDWKANGESSYDYLRVALVPASVALEASTSLPAGLSTNTLPDGWVALDGGAKLNQVTTWQNMNVDIDVQEGLYNVVLVWRNDYSTGTDAPAAVDNFSISKLMCARPDALALGSAGVTTSSAQLEWNPQGSESNWLLRYKKHADEEWTVLSEPVSANPFMLTGLEASMNYDVQVAAWCDPADPEAVSAFCDIFTFATACDVLAAFPYVENFDGVEGSTSENVLPVCWDHFNSCSYQGYTDYSIYPTVYESSSYANSGSNALRFYSLYDDDTDYDPQDQYAILPRMENISGLRMKLMARAYSSSSYYSTYDATFIVGVMSEPSDVTSFVPVATFTPASTSYQEYNVIFANYEGDGEYIAIKAEAAMSGIDYRAVLIDDIRVEELPSCLEASGLVVSNVSATGASFAWDAIDGGAWKYAIAPAADGVPADDAFISIDVNALSLESGLNENTAYVIYLRRDCGSSVSPTISAAFTTKQMPAELPYASDFEAGCDWAFINGSLANAWVWGDAASNGEGTHALYISNDGGASNAYTQSAPAMVYAVKSFNFTDGSYIFSYDWKANGENNYDYLRVALVPVSVELAAATAVPSGFSTTGLPDGWIALDGGSQLNLATEWQTFASAEIAVPAGTYNVVLAWRDDTSGGSNEPAAVDNFSISKVACGRPVNLSVSDRTATSAVIDWLGDSEQSAWQLILSEDADVDLDEATPIDIASKPYALADLEPETTYYIYVRANCGEGFSEWSARTSFTTASTCQMPDDIVLEAVTTTSATISWYTYGQTGFDFRYSTDGTNWIEVANVSMPYTLEGLEPGSSYRIQIKAACSDDEWTASQSFTTVYGVPFSENFAASSLPAGWFRASGNLANVINGTEDLYSASGSWNVGTNNNVFDNHAYINIYGTTIKHWLIMPEILLEGNIQLSFDLALTKYSSSDSPTAGSQADDKFAVVISADDGETWSILRQWDNAGSAYVYDNISNTGDFVEIDLSARSGEQVYIAFYGESTVSGGDNNLHIDNVLIDAIPACPKPTGLHIESLNDTQVSLAWDAIDDVAWEFGLVANPADGFVPEDADFTGSATLSAVTIDTLVAQTSYLFFLRKVCGEDMSEIVYRAFTTTQAATALPFDEDFEAATSWNLINGACENAWVIGSGANNTASGANALYISNDGATNAYTTSSAAMVYAAKLFNFDKAGSYTVSYDWKANGESTYDYLRVAVVPSYVELNAGTSVLSGLSATSLPAGWIAADEGSKLNLSNEWTNKTVEIELEPGLYNLVFAWRDDTSTGSQDPAAVDNIHIQHKAYPTDIEGGAGVETKAVKFLKDNHVYILVNGTVYTVMGQKVELK